MLPELNQELDEFVDGHVNNFIKWDLIVFFHQNQETIGTSRAIATRLGRRQEDVAEALASLVASGILKTEPSHEGDIYHFVADGERAALVGEFITALDSREHRLQILTKLLRLGARG